MPRSFRFTLLLLLFSWAVSSAIAADRWYVVKSGPFLVYSEGKPKAAQERAAELEQFRYSLGELLGRKDLTIRPSLTLFVSPTSTSSTPLESAQPIVTRSGSLAFECGSGPFGPAFKSRLAAMLLEQNVGRLPEPVERGLHAFLSTTSVEGAHVVWGAPPSPPERTLDWALISWLVTTPETYGKVRVLLGNLQKGIAEEVAYRNAFGKDPLVVAKEARSYLARGSFATIDAASRPLSAERDLPARPIDSDSVELARADLLGPGSQPAYEALLRGGKHVVEAQEGLAILAVRRKDLGAARELLAKAVAGGSKNEAALIEYARLETDPALATAALERALGVNKESAEAHYLLGRLRSEPNRQIGEWNQAVKYDPRRQEYWIALAEANQKEKQWTEAARAWRGAEQAATTQTERDRMLQARLAIEAQRLDYEDAERRRIAAEKQAEIDRLKQQLPRRDCQRDSVGRTQCVGSASGRRTHRGGMHGAFQANRRASRRRRIDSLVGCRYEPRVWSTPECASRGRVSSVEKERDRRRSRDSSLSLRKC